MKAFFFALAGAGMLVAYTGEALAGWSAPQTLPVRGASELSMAVNARGDTAIAWARGPAKPRPYGTSVHLTVRTRKGRVRSRTIWSSSRASTGDIAVAIDDKGEVSVAWIVNTRRNQGGASGPGKLYAAFGRLGGRWARTQILGSGITQPRLAVAPNGRVLLLWIDGDAESRHLVLAWRARGHRFRDRGTMNKPAVVFAPSDSTGAVPAFDAAGAAYVTGECDAVVRRARRNSHRFRTILDRGPAVSTTLSLAGAGRGIAASVKGSCTSDVSAPNTPGPVFADILRGGRFGPAVALPSTDRATFTHAVAVAADGGIVSWGDPAAVLSTTVAATGSIAAPTPSPTGVVPFASDGGGDQVLAGPGSGGELVQFGVFLQPVGGGALEPAPTSHGMLAVSQPRGRRVALAWDPSPSGGSGRLALSVWRP